jgi:hypothetical protein
MMNASTRMQLRGLGGSIASDMELQCIAGTGALHRRLADLFTVDGTLEVPCQV